MVAYSFQKQFVDPIQSGRKAQTIRALGKRRHAQQGDALQLYTGMRTKHCRLIARAKCWGMDTISISFSSMYPGDEVRIGVGPRIWQQDLEPFAMSDGFSSWSAMKEFWRQHHPNVLVFHGVIIYWGNMEPVR